MDKIRLENFDKIFVLFSIIWYTIYIVKDKHTKDVNQNDKKLLQNSDLDFKWNEKNRIHYYKW